MKLKRIRSKISEKLNMSDFSQLDDVKARMSEEEVKAWYDYRQALMDLAENVKSGDKIKWPKRPANTKRLSKIKED